MRQLWLILKTTADPSTGASVIFHSWIVSSLNISVGTPFFRLEEDSHIARCKATAHAPDSVFAVVVYAFQHGIECERAREICDWIEDVRRVYAVLGDVRPDVDVFTLIFTKGTGVGFFYNLGSHRQPLASRTSVVRARGRSSGAGISGLGDSYNAFVPHS